MGINLDQWISLNLFSSKLFLCLLLFSLTNPRTYDLRINAEYRARQGWGQVLDQVEGEIELPRRYLSSLGGLFLRLLIHWLVKMQCWRFYLPTPDRSPKGISNGYARRCVATRVAEGQTNLDYFEQINVALHGLIVIPTLLRKITVHDLGARRPKDRTKSAHKHFVDDRNRSLIMS